MFSKLSHREMSGLGFAFLAVFLFSLSLPMTKWALESFDPFFTATARAVIAALLALILIAIKKVPIFHRKDLRAFAYTTAGAVFGWPILVALALNRTTTAQVAVIAAIMPLVTALLAVLRTHERATISFWIGSALGTLILILFALSRGGGTNHDQIADLLTLLAVFSSSWCYVEGAALTKIYPGWQVISWVVIIALPINIPLSIFLWSRTHQNYSFTFHGITGLLVIGIFSMYLGFFAWYKGLNQAGTVRGSQIQQLQAIFTLGWAVILLKEKVSITTLASALGVIICVLWALSTRNKTIGSTSNSTSTSSTYESLPENLPIPVDDGGADHLLGRVMPPLTFISTNNESVNLPESSNDLIIIFIYPRTGVPGVALPDGWNEIPGARGCTPEICGFRDNFSEFTDAGVRIFGLSSQDTEYQKEIAARLQLPFPILSDPDLSLAKELNLPTFSAAGMRLYKRLTLIIKNQKIIHTFYPIFPTDTHGEKVLEWLTLNKTSLKN